MYSLIFLKTVVKIFQDVANWYFSQFDDSFAPSTFTLVFYYAVILLSKIKNNSVHILVEICQAIYLMWMLERIALRLCDCSF